MGTIKGRFKNKKALNLILILVLLTLTSCTKSSQKNNLSELNLKGKVKSIRETSFQAIEKFGEVVKTERKSEYNYQEDFYHIFNASGNFIESYFYLPDESLSSKKTYQYGEQQKFIGQCSYSSDGKLYSREIYKYDENGKITDKEFCDSLGIIIKKMLLKYDDRGNLKEETTYNSKGEITHKTKFEYDSKNQLIEDIDYDEKGEFLFKTIFQYDNNGNIEKEKSNLGLGFNYGNIYEYDDKGNMTCEKFYSIVTGKISSERTYKYIYDKNSNWIKKTKYKNNTPLFIIEREIEYYK